MAYLVIPSFREPLVLNQLVIVPLSQGLRLSFLFSLPATVSFPQHPKEDSVGYPSPKVKLQFCSGDMGEEFGQILLPFPQQLLVSPPLLPIKVDLTNLFYE